MAYEVAEGVDNGALKASVAKLEAKGYRPMGGIAVRGFDGVLFQGMWKDDSAPVAAAVELQLREPEPPQAPRPGAHKGGRR